MLDHTTHLKPWVFVKKSVGFWYAVYSCAYVYNLTVPTKKIRALKVYFCALASSEHTKVFRFRGRNKGRRKLLFLFKIIRDQGG